MSDLLQFDETIGNKANRENFADSQFFETNKLERRVNQNEEAIQKELKEKEEQGEKQQDE